MTISTPEQLVEALKAFQSTQDDTPAQGYRYVIYARKSTDDSEKQARSLSDQILECREFANTHNLKIVETIQESESAKQADIRPRFREMIQKIQAGKFDAILAWHPDRLARNMKDAGEIIDLLDRGIIKDLKFKSSYFENTATGKMMLGIAFVLSKQYSDHLSDSVSRGNRRSLAEGKHIGAAKHGYFKDSYQYLRPDGDNFLLIKQAFQLRLEGKILDEIATYLNERGYRRIKSDGSHRPYRMDKQRVEKILRDPVYTGVLVHGKSGVVNLHDHYDFQAAVSVEDFMKINRLSSKAQMIRLSKTYRKDDTVKSDLLRGMVNCGHCGEPMVTGITAKKGVDGKVSRYFYYRCDQDDCDFYGKSVRAKVVTAYVYDYLNTRPFSSKGSHQHYIEEMKTVSVQQLATARSEQQSLQVRKRNLEERYEGIKELLIGNHDDKVKAAFTGDLERYKDEIIAATAMLEAAKARSSAMKESPLTYADFLELMDSMPKILGSIQNMSELDYIIKKIFLNFTVKDKRVIKSTLNSPFDKLETLKVSNGGRGET